MKKIRLNLELSQHAHDGLLFLRGYTGATSRTEVIKSALKLYEDVVREKGKGNSLMIQEESGMIYPYKVLIV